MDRATVAVYEANAAEYRRRRRAYDPDRAARFAAAVPTTGRRLDLGCGPGLYAGLLGRPLVASDAALARSRGLLVERWPGDLEEGPLSVRGGVAAIDRRRLTGLARRPAPSSAGAGRVAPIVMLAVALLLVAGLPLLS